MASDAAPTGIVVPCYNEAARLMPAAFARFLAERPGVRFCFVNDGSTDRTVEVLRDLKRQASASRLDVLDLDVNRGKGEAVRAGVLALAERRDLAYIGYWDADLATPLSEIDRFLEVFARKPAVRLVLGSRVRRLGAVIERHWWRHYRGRVFATATAMLLRLPVYDTQCGAKMFAATLARPLFGEAFHSRWFFDVEVVARAVRLWGRTEALAAIHELPLEAWHDRRGSKISARAIATAPLDLARIGRAYGLMGRAATKGR